MTIWSHVITFDGDSANGGISGASSDKPYAIVVEPANPQVGEEYRVYVYSSESWDITAPAGNLDGQLGGARDPGWQTETVSNLAQRTIDTRYPVSQIDHSQCRAMTPIVDADGKVSIPRFSWIDLGIVNEKPVVDQKFPVPGYGTIQITYETVNGQGWLLAGHPEAGEYVFFLNRRGREKKIPVLIKVAASETTTAASTPQSVTIEVRDYCADTVIPGADVYVDNAYKGISNDKGLLNVGVLQPGSHNLRIVKSGYVATDNDALQNDLFTI